MTLLTPEEVEARFQRIEATLAAVAESQARTQMQQEINTREIAATNQKLNEEAENLALMLNNYAASTDAAIQRLADILSERFRSNGQH